MPSNPVLRKMALPVRHDEDVGWANNMIDVMLKRGGVGLAAPQVGISKRVIVVTRSKKPEIFINPQIIEASGWEWNEEGCLSVPRKRVRKLRNSEVKVIALNINLQPLEFVCQGLEAICFQHEIDHLNGRLMID